MKYVLLFFSLCVSMSTSCANAVQAPLKVTLQHSKITLDPGGIQDSQSLLISRQINCQLFRNEGSTFVLDAAESVRYETPLRLILKIKSQAKFSDGSPVTAADVIESMEYIKTRRDIVRNLYSWISSVQAADEKTMVFNLKRPAPQFLRVLSATNYTIYQRDFLKRAIKNKKLWKQPVGCGGYRVESFTDSDVLLTPVSSGLPIEFIMIKANQIAASEMNNYDIVTLGVVGDSGNVSNYSKVDIFDPLQFYIGLNTKSSIWDDKNERCKFLSSLDVKPLIAQYGGSATIANDLIPGGTLGYRQDANYQSLLIKNANKKLNIPKMDKTQRFCLAYLTLSIQEKYKDDFLAMVEHEYPGVDLRPMTNVVKFGKRFSDSHCDAILFAWRSNYLDGYEYLTIYGNNDANFTGFHDASLSREIENSQAVIEPVNRYKAYRHIINSVADMCIARPLFTVPVKEIYMRKNLTAPGVGLVPFHQYYLGNIQRSNSY